MKFFYTVKNDKGYHMNTILVMTLSLIAVTVIYTVGDEPLVEKKKTEDYTQMSTAALQQEVERLSQKDMLPFPMGLELIKRWSKAK